MSKVAAAITSPATKAAKQENSTKSLRSIRIRAPSPLLRGLRVASKRLIVAKDRARRHRVEAEGLGLSFRALAGLAQNEEPGRSGGEAGGLTPFESAKPMDGSANLLCCCRYSTKTRIKQPLQCAVEFAHLIISTFWVEVQRARVCPIRVISAPSIPMRCQGRPNLPIGWLRGRQSLL
jgi:hypothetical protein